MLIYCQGFPLDYKLHNILVTLSISFIAVPQIPSIVPVHSSYSMNIC